MAQLQANWSSTPPTEVVDYRLYQTFGLLHMLNDQFAAFPLEDAFISSFDAQRYGKALLHAVEAKRVRRAVFSPPKGVWVGASEKASVYCTDDIDIGILIDGYINQAAPMYNNPKLKPKEVKLEGLGGAGTVMLKKIGNYLVDSKGVHLTWSDKPWLAKKGKQGKAAKAMSTF